MLIFHHTALQYLPFSKLRVWSLWAIFRMPAVYSVRVEMGKWGGFSIACRLDVKQREEGLNLRISGIPTLFRFQLVNEEPVLAAWNV